MIGSKKFVALVFGSALSSAMLYVDGLFARRAAVVSVTAVTEQSQNMAFWQLWVPLLLVQIVVVVLVHRDTPSPLQRNLIYFGVFIFLIATLYSLTGFHQLINGTAATQIS